MNPKLKYFFKDYGKYILFALAVGLIVSVMAWFNGWL